MYKEAYQEIKKISGDELRELLSDLDNVYHLCKCTWMGECLLCQADF